MTKNQKISLSITLGLLIIYAIELVVDYQKRDALQSHPVILILAGISVLVFLILFIWKK